MPRYIVHCDTGFCGVNDDVIVEATDELEADEIAQDWWNDQVVPSVDIQGEITKENEEEYEGYQEIN